MPNPEPTLRILVVRLGAMGDILHALPAVTALRAALPKSYIGWAVKPQWSALLRAENGDAVTRGAQMPLVDRLHSAPVEAWGRAPLSPNTLRQIAALRGELRAERYDLCLDLQGAVRSALLGTLSGAPRKIGEAAPRERIARWFFNEKIPTHGKHVIEQAREVAEAVLHQPLPMVTAMLPRDEQAEAWCERWLHERGIERFILVNPGAGWGAKCWPAERYGQVAAAMARMGYTTVLNAGPGEFPLAQQAEAASQGNAVILTCTLGQLIACTRRAQVFLGGDTGPLHLAAALQRPVVGIYGPTDPARNGPFATRARVLRHPESQRNHARRKQPEAGLLTITVEDAVQAIRQMLQEASA